MFNLKLFSDEISDLQAEIDRRGFKWTAGKTSLSNIAKEVLNQILNCGCDESELYNDYEYCSLQPSNSSQILHPSTSIKNQLNGICASCWSFAAIATMETLALEAGFPAEYIDLSEQFMVDICTENYTEEDGTIISCQDPGGCYGGSIVFTNNFVQNCGIPEEWCRQYEANDYKDCHIESCTSESDKDKRFKVGYICKVFQEVNELKNALNEGPLFSSLKIYESFYSYTSGVYQKTESYNPAAPTHFIEVIGYQDDSSGPFGGGYFICKNSFGTGWGSRLCKYEGKWVCDEYGDEKGVCPQTKEKGFFCIAYNQIDYSSGVDFGKQTYLYGNLIEPDHYSIEGNILNDNYSKEGINVNLKHYASHNNKWFNVRNFYTDSAGAYQFNYVLNWDYRVEPENLDWCFKPQYQDIILDENKENLNFSIGYDIYGSTKFAFLKPISGVNISLSDTDYYAASDQYGNYSFSGILCGNYTISASKDNCQFIPSSYNFTLSYSDYNIPTFYCFLKVAGKLGPIFVSNSTVNVSGIATNGDQINQTTNVDSSGNFTFYLPEGSYTFKPSSECMVYNPPLLQQNVIYDENLNIFLNFTSYSWKICSSCYSTYFAREIECSNLIGVDKDTCLLNAKNEFKGCVTLKTNDANSYLYNAIILSIQVQRSKGKPKEVVESFIVEEEGDYFINITNGDNLNKDTAVSSAEINIEGIGQVFGPSDFNKNVFQLKKQVHLTAGQYQISTMLKSQPDSYLTIVISNKDISSFPELP